MTWIRLEIQPWSYMYNKIAPSVHPKILLFKCTTNTESEE